MIELRHLRLIVTGLVQGVFYRASTKEIATQLSLVGYVRNLPDGSVEINAQGSAKAVEALHEWAKKGPKSARVDSIKITELPLDETLKDFLVRF